MECIRPLRAAIVMLVLLAGAADAWAAEAATPRLGDRMMDYHNAPNPIAAFGWLAESDSAALASPQAVDLVALFYAHILRAHPELTARFVEGLLRPEVGGRAVLVGATAVWLAGGSDRNVHVATLAGDGRLAPESAKTLKGFASFDKEALRAESPHEMDLCWISFFATGDGDYVEKVAEALPNLLPPALMEQLAGREEPEARIAFQRSLIAGAASWSLLANAERHPAVAERLRAIALSREDRVGVAAKVLVQRLSH